VLSSGFTPVRCQNSMEALDQVFLSAGLGCSPVLVDQSAEDSVTSDRGVEGDHGGRVVVGRVLAQALVRTVVIEMVLVLVQDGAGVPFVENRLYCHGCGWAVCGIGGWPVGWGARA
jgi:hypothetical protein